LYSLFYLFFVFFAPNYFGHPDNYIPANSDVTPAHIVPEWYFLPFYAILRSVPNKLVGVILLVAAIIVLLLFPFLISDSSVRSTAFRPVFKIFF
jgi:quinol-cytochrome oxidoreductase complex cytochrome b subunit